MSSRGIQQRVARMEARKREAFAAFQRRLPPADRRPWQVCALEALAAHGMISPPPVDLWERAQPEKDAYLMMLRERLEGRPREAEAVIWEAWHAWEQEHGVQGIRR